MAAYSNERDAAIAIVIVVTVIPFSIGVVAVAAVYHMTLSAYMAFLLSHHLGNLSDLLHAPYRWQAANR